MAERGIMNIELFHSFIRFFMAKRINAQYLRRLEH